jgi:drug/metabolite transporter (DMT)-like permease
MSKLEARHARPVTLNVTAWVAIVIAIVGLFLAVMIPLLTASLLSGVLGVACILVGAVVFAISQRSARVS